jgi:hypothetical protein
MLSITATSCPLPQNSLLELDVAGRRMHGLPAMMGIDSVHTRLVIVGARLRAMAVCCCRHCYWKYTQLPPTRVSEGRCRDTRLQLRHPHSLGGIFLTWLDRIPRPSRDLDSQWPPS